MDTKELIDALRNENETDASAMMDYMADAADLLEKQQNKIGDLEYEAQEREKIVVQLWKQWQDAEMFICSMCGHFDRKTDGNIVYGNQDCGEIVGYPYCEKFTPWVSVDDRLPEKNSIVIAAFTYVGVKKQFAGVVRYTENDGIPDWEYVGMKITHWIPIPELPKEESE